MILSVLCSTALEALELEPVQDDFSLCLSPSPNGHSVNSLDTIRIYLGVAEAALNGNVQPLLNRVNRHLDGLDNNPATTYALITNILPAGNAYLFNNLPEFLQHAQRLQEALEREGRGEVFYTFWRVEQREAARRGLPGDVPARRASRAEGALRAADLPLEEAMPISATIVAAINSGTLMILVVKQSALYPAVT